MSHKAQAIALTCIDFRFRKPIQNFLEKELGMDFVDHKADGGGVKMIVEEGPIRDWIFANFDIAFNLHDVNRIILINHQDCGAYGGSKSFENTEAELKHHTSELQKAKKILEDKYPGKEIEGYIALISKDEEVSFKKIL